MRAKRKNQPYFIVGALGVAMALLAIRFRMPGDLIGLIIAGTGGTLYWFYMSPYWHAQKVFKSIMLPQVVKSIDENLKYSHVSQFSKDKLVFSWLATPTDSTPGPASIGQDQIARFSKRSPIRIVRDLSLIHI